MAFNTNLQLCPNQAPHLVLATLGQVKYIRLQAELERDSLYKQSCAKSDVLSIIILLFQIQATEVLPSKVSIANASISQDHQQRPLVTVFITLAQNQL